MSNDNGAALVVAQPTPVGIMALEPRGIEEGLRLATIAAKTRMYGVSSPEDAFVRMATGMALGLTAWQSLRGLFVISGKVGIAADLMLALCLSSPECEGFRCVETSAEVATFEAKRKGQPPQRMSFTMAEARQAGLTGNAMYSKYPANMLRARAIGFLARLVFPERMHGILTREELEGIEDERSETGSPAPVEPAPVAPLVRPGLPPGSPAHVVGEALTRLKDGTPTREDIDLLIADARPKVRAQAWAFCVEKAPTVEDLALVVQGLQSETHEKMRTDMLVKAEARRKAIQAALDEADAQAAADIDSGAA